MPALVKRRLGESGRREEDGTMAWDRGLDWKKSKKDWRMADEVMKG
jgi:hypothetical protein